MTNMTPIEQIRQLLAATPVAEPGAPPQVLRESMDKVMEQFPPPEGTVITPETLGGVAGESVLAPGAGDKEAVLYFHGGGYVIGSPRTHRTLTGKLSQTSDAVVKAIDYRLAPENPFPAALDDALAAYRALLENYPAEKIAVSGDSAGGGLAFALLLKLREEGLPMPACAAPISPWTDLTGQSATLVSLADKDPMVQKEPLLEMAALYHGKQSAKNPFVSPLFADLSGLPPLLVLVGSDETLLDDSRAIHKNAQSAGVQSTLEIWPDMIHVWPMFHTFLPEGAQALDKIGKFMRRHWNA